LKHVKDKDLVHGQFGKWLESININQSTADKMIKTFERFSNSELIPNLGMAKMFEITYLPESVDKQQFIQEPHTIPSTGEQKTVDDMTVKELREVKKALKEEQEKSRKLLAANFGRMKNNPIKQRKIAVEYVGLCNPKQGKQKSGDNRRISIKDIAEQLGTNERSLYELLEIERKLTPEIKELLDAGIITKTSASKIWTKLSEKLFCRFFKNKSGDLNALVGQDNY
jgi:hypothetical protein